MTPDIASALESTRRRIARTSSRHSSLTTLYLHATQDAGQQAFSDQQKDRSPDELLDKTRKRSYAGQVAKVDAIRNVDQAGKRLDEERPLHPVGEKWQRDDAAGK